MIDFIGYALCLLVPAAVIGHMINWCLDTLYEINETEGF